MTTSFIVLEKGATGFKVTRLQEVLTQLKFNVGTIDGFFGTKTQAAVIKFQQSYKHLPDNGIVDVETILQLDQVLWLSQRENLKEGSRGNEVELLQGMLEYSNFGSLKVDGVFGAKTKATVIDFQKARGLKPDGIVEQKTWSSLYTLARHDIPNEQRVDIFFGLDSEILIKLPLKKGDEGRDVLILQKYLNYVSGSTHGILEDGHFGQATEQTVKNFQQRKGLVVDGAVGMQTYQNMVSEGLNRQLVDQLLN